MLFLIPLLLIAPIVVGLIIYLVYLFINNRSTFYKALIVVLTGIYLIYYTWPLGKRASMNDIKTFESVYDGDEDLDIFRGGDALYTIIYWYEKDGKEYADHIDLYGDYDIYEESEDTNKAISGIFTRTEYTEKESKVLVNTSVRLVNNKLVIDLPEGAWEYPFDTTLAQNIRFDNDFFKKLKIERGGHAITQSYYYLRGTANNESFNNFFNFDDISFGIESESKYENIEIEINGVSRKYRYFERYIYDREDVEAYLETLND